ncbi:MAG: hypothetical protein KDC61_01290 [Saprospiraceae bacterium]|nr:hypothetical protein [Saprospiraceae bacterium]MCB0573185.1 hypothetical protein [Saprospiraceae bacterium]
MNEIVFNRFLWAWIIVAIAAFVYLLRVNAPYGRHAKPGWGPTVDNRLGWFLMEFPVIVFFLTVLFSGTNSISGMVAFFCGCFLLHYIHRSIVFPLRLRTRGKRMPVIIVASAIFFNLVNGCSLGYYFGYLAEYPATWTSDPRFWGGLLLFVTGLAINWHSDHILIRLRKPGDTGYAIPNGGAFRLVSCPNLFGELLEWSGYALMTWCLPAFVFAFWTAANLIPRALAHHRWYVSEFSGYPGERKAIIPFLL